MLASLSLIFIVGLAMGAICQKLRLPRIIGILVTGIVLGPYVLGKNFGRKCVILIAEKKKMTGVFGDDQKSHRRRFVAHRRNFCI